MEKWQFVLSLIMGTVTILLLIYLSFTSRQKGPVFSNTYILLNKEQKGKADKKAEYQLVTLIFCGLAMFTLMDTIHIMTLSKLPLIFGFLFIGFDIIYVIFNAIKK